eukprot:GEZU01026353.1.p1 GENE.GEZU01026353.1~~GEZU01026353.1.p1  ORF type:complete len:276 (-),score=25.01 GEZU01026353.1:272-1099(-)
MFTKEREEVQQIARRKSIPTNQSCLILVRSVWTRLCKLPQADPLCISAPLYESPVVSHILTHVMKNALLLERASHTQEIEIESGGNVLISGPKGVGKSFLMRGVASVISLLCPHVLTVYHDYQRGATTPLGLIKHACKMRYSDSPFVSKVLTAPNIERCLRELRQESIFVAFFADEVQHLFVKGAARESLEVQIVSQILIIGKEHNTFGVVSGSSSDVSRTVFKEKRQDPAECICQLPGPQQLGVLRQPAPAASQQNGADECHPIALSRMVCGPR